MPFRFEPLSGSHDRRSFASRSAALNTYLQTLALVAAPGDRIVLLRAIGPSLSKFGITDGLSDPYLAIDGDDRTRVVGYNSLGFFGEEKHFADLFRVVGAFAFDS